MSKLAQKILSNTAIQIGGKIITSVISVLIIKYITSLEGVPGLSGLPAEYKLIYTYLTFFGIIADFGLFTIAVREMSQAEEKDEQQRILGNIVGMRTFTIILTMAMAALFVFLIPSENYTERVKLGVSIAAITTVLTMMASTVSSVLQVHLRMNMPTIALVLGKIVMAVYIITVVFFFQEIPYAFYHLLLAGIAGSLLTFLITYGYTKSWYPFSPRFEIPYWKKVFKEALPYGMAIILSTLYFKVDVLILSFLRDKQEIAIYGFPSSIIEMLSIFPVYFMNSTLPTLSKAYKESKEKTKELLRLSLLGMVSLSLPMVVGGLVLARPLMSLVMNEAFLTGNVVGYYGSDLAFQLLLFPTLFAFVTHLFSYSLIAAGQQAKLLKINAVGVIFNIVLNLIFIPKYGFIAAGITTVFSEMIVLTLTYLNFRKTFQLIVETKKILYLVFASLVMGLFVYLNQSLIHVVPLVGFGAIVYGLLLIPIARQNLMQFRESREK